MTTFTVRNLTQTAVYWGSPQPDGYGGYTWSDPIEISCRWAASDKMMTSSLGEEFVASAELHVAEDLEVGGAVFLGSLDDVDSGDYDDPVAAGAYQILRFDSVPSVKGDKILRKAYVGPRFSVGG